MGQKVSKRVWLFLAGGVLIGSILAGGWWTARERSLRDAEERKQRRGDALRELETREAHLRELERLLDEAETMSEQEREKLRREIEQERRHRRQPGEYPPQYRPEPRRCLDPSCNRNSDPKR